MHPFDDQVQAWSRRQFFQRSGFNLGAIALGSLLSSDLKAAATAPADPLAPLPAALRAAGQADHLSAHDRRSEPVGSFRFQAGAGEA